eukprot:8448120-Pyramimonas_sp.AAC.1
MGLRWFTRTATGSSSGGSTSLFVEEALQRPVAHQAAARRHRRPLARRWREPFGGRTWGIMKFRARMARLALPGGIADNLDAQKTAASILEEGGRHNEIITTRMQESTLSHNASKQENVLLIAGHSAAFIEAKFAR